MRQRLFRRLVFLVRTTDCFNVCVYYIQYVPQATPRSCVGSRICSHLNERQPFTKVTEDKTVEESKRSTTPLRPLPRIGAQTYPVTNNLVCNQCVLQLRLTKWPRVGVLLTSAAMHMFAQCVFLSLPS